MLHFQCPSCGKRLRAAPAMIGKSAPCPVCKYTVPILRPPEPPPDAPVVDYTEPTLLTEAGPDHDEPASSIPVSPRGRRKLAPNGDVLRRAGIAAACVVVLFLFFVVIMEGSRTSRRASLEREGRIWERKSVSYMVDHGEFHDFLEFNDRYRAEFGYGFGNRPPEKER